MFDPACDERPVEFSGSSGRVYLVEQTIEIDVQDTTCSLFERKILPVSIAQPA